MRVSDRPGVEISAPIESVPEKAGEEFRMLTSEDLTLAEGDAGRLGGEPPEAPAGERGIPVAPKEGVPAAETLRSPEYKGRLTELAETMRKLDTVVNDVNRLRSEGAAERSVRADPLESLIGGIKVNVEGEEADLKPEVFVGQWSRLIEAGGDDKSELLGMIERILTEEGRESLARRLFIEYAKSRPEGVSDGLNNEVEATVSRLKNSLDVAGAANVLVNEAESKSNDKISMWNIIFWILGSLAAVTEKGADAVVKEIIETAGGGR